MTRGRLRFAAVTVDDGGALSAGDDVRAGEGRVESC